MGLEVRPQFFPIWCSFGSININSVRMVQFVVCVPGEHMNMEVPEVLIPGRFIVLPSGGPVAVVCGTDCNRYLFGDFIHITDGIIGYVVYIFEMMIGYHDHVPPIVGPGARGDKRSHIVRAIDDIVLAVSWGYLTRDEIAEWAAVVFWRMIMHWGYYSLLNENLRNEKKEFLAGYL